MHARTLMGGAAALMIALAGVAGAQGKGAEKKAEKATKSQAAKGKAARDAELHPKGQARQELRGRFTDAEQRSWREALARSDLRATSLPPGIAKNLARGKPLPPGIAKRRVPDDVLRRVPRTWENDEYEHVIVGQDVVRTDRMGRILDIMRGMVVR